MTLDEIGIVAVDDSEQLPKRVERHGMLSVAERGGFLKHLQGKVLKIVRLFGQERGHLVDLRAHVLPPIADIFAGQ
jgi:hypothetical protein